MGVVKRFTLGLCDRLTTLHFIHSVTWEVGRWCQGKGVFGGGVVVDNLRCLIKREVIKAGRGEQEGEAALPCQDLLDTAS